MKSQILETTLLINWLNENPTVISFEMDTSLGVRFWQVGLDTGWTSTNATEIQPWRSWPRHKL